MKNIVTAEWLIDNIDRNDVIILDCRFRLEDSDYGKKAYRESHIVNALFVDLKGDLAEKAAAHGGRHPLPDMNKFIKKMESLGLNTDSTVIIYDDGDLAGATRLWWMLKYTGKDRVYVLEGGFDNWKSHGFETTSEIPEHLFPGKLSLNLNTQMICNMEHVREAIGRKDTAIIDSRSRERYLGEVEPIDKKAGHIPGSLNYFWKDIFRGNQVKDLGELKEWYRNLVNYKEIIVHCGSGITACPNILAMEEIGLKPVLYPGGWSDWISYEENMVVSGQQY